MAVEIAGGPIGSVFAGQAAAFAAAIDALERGSRALSAARWVQDLLLLRDPEGNRHQLFWGYRCDFRRFVSADVPCFVTGAPGMGHAVLPAPNFDATRAFFRDVLGFGLADLYRHRYTDDPQEPLKRIYFTDCTNGRAHDRMLEHCVKLMATPGRHVNDQVISL